MIAKESKNVIR